jgi:23S rRNA pseudouridine2605 synthase
VRLNAYLARAGIASRRGAEDLIRAGRVRVNGHVAGLATFVAKRDRVEVDGRPVELEPLGYVLLHKPAGVVTTARDPQGRPTVVGLVGHERRLVPVGRLDADTTGVLLLTNDGPLAHRLMHPRYEMEKVYEAEVEGEPSDETLSRLAEGVELEDGRTAPARVRALGRGRIELALHEGRKHQVKRMCEAVGHPVRRLHRSSYAGLTVAGLAAGEWRELTAAEVERLRALTQADQARVRVRSSRPKADEGGRRRTSGPAPP